MRKLKEDSRSLADRLASRGITPRKYGTVLAIADGDLPHPMLYFQKQFPHRTPAQVVAQIGVWREFLLKDFVLSDSEKELIARSLGALEFSARLAIVDHLVHFSEPWRVETKLILDSNHNCPRPTLKIMATHSKTGKRREALVPPKEIAGANWWSIWEKALTRMGLLQFAMENYSHKLFTRREPHAWPIFTQVVIPRLYLALAPYYRKPGNVHVPQEGERDAQYPIELLRDMAEMLRQAHPEIFSKLKTQHLKARIQNYLLKRDASIKSNKSA
jgi:hypothetical protein